MQRLAGTPSTLRAINDRIALELLLEHGQLSRSQLVRLTGVSKPTASELLSRLESDGVVIQRGTTSGARGPNAQLYAINERIAFVAAINAEEDLVTVAVADITGQVLGEARVAADFTDGRDPVPVLHEAFEEAVRLAQVPRESMVAAVVGVTGAYDARSDTVVYARHLPGWERPGVVERLRQALACDVQVENDANLAAVGERTRGCAQDAETFALLWVARGLGLAIELGGRVYRGATGGAGEVGYIPIGGRAASFQDSVGGPAIVALARRHGISAPTPADALEIARARGDAGLGFLGELAERLATGVATIAAVIDPPLLVLGGATVHAGGQALVDLVATEVRRLSPFHTELALSSVPGSPVLAGAVDSAVAQGRAAVFGTPGSQPWAPTAPQSRARA